MTVLTDIITPAMQMARILPLGENPSTAEATGALQRFNGMCRGMFGGGVGLPLWSHPLTSSIDHCRLWGDKSYNFQTTGASVTLTLPASPQPGQRFGVTDAKGNLSTFPVTIDGNGWPIEGAATLTLNTDSLSASWFFRPDTGWTREQDVALSGDSLFPASLNDALAAMLALRLVEYGVEPSAGLVRMADLGDRKFAIYRPKSAVSVDPAMLTYQDRNGYPEGWR